MPLTHADKLEQDLDRRDRPESTRVWLLPSNAGRRNELSREMISQRLASETECEQTESDHVGPEVVLPDVLGSQLPIVDRR